MSGANPVRPDAVLSDPARETMRKLFWCGPLQIEDLPSRDGLGELIEAGWSVEVKGWHALTENGVGACLWRGYGREKERSITKPA